MSEIKAALKDARNAIDKKEFQEAIKFCKIILQNDKNNYNALIMLGAALQDSDEAAFAFKKAISIKKDKILAWQGLANYYERKKSPENDNELIGIYEYMFKAEEDTGKCINIYNKLYELAQTSDDLPKIAEILFGQAVNNDSIEKKNAACQILLKLLMNNQSAASEELINLFEKVLVNTNFKDLDDNFRIKYLNYIHKSKGLNIASLSCSELLKDNISNNIKEWFCKKYVEEFILKNIHDTPAEILTYIDELLLADENSEIGRLTKAVLLYIQKDYINAYNNAYIVQVYRKADVFVYVILGLCCLRLQRWLEAESIAQNLLLNNDEYLSTIIMKILLTSLSSQQNEEKCLQAFEIQTKIETSLEEAEYISLLKGYIYVNNLNEAEVCLMHLKESNDFFALNAMFLSQTKRVEEALQILESNKTDHPSCWLELGLLYCKRDECEKSLMPLLHAARVFPFNFEIFVALGDYYSKFNVNLEKAKKCYLKAFTLNPECAKAGKCLSSIYRSLHNWAENYDLLKNLKGWHGSWSCLQFGLHHLALNEWDEAVFYLRTFLRLNANNVEAWELLADAYYSRGSFTSALKCYKKATELNNQRKYSLVQIGSIHCLLGEYAEALVTYKTLNDMQFLPALKGMAEVKLAIANEKYTQNLYGNCRDNAQDAIELATSAILIEGQFVSLWKILSNAVSVIARLPSKYKWLYIDGKFIGDETKKFKMFSKNDVYTLAIRFFCRTINLASDNNSYLYYDLASIYLDYYRTTDDPDVIQKAFAAIKKCLSIEKNDWQHWNLLGVICMCKDIKKYSLGQHAIIKAIELDFSNAMLWSNLGILYFYLNNIALSNKSFQKAQQFDPAYLQSWIGQALIAESVGHEDAMDLFRHSSQLGFHKESSLGYAEWVCKTLMTSISKTDSKVEYSIKNMFAIPTACDLMTWFSEYDIMDACSLNIYGIILEKMGIFHKAAKSYEEALNHVDDTNKDTVVVNLGRVYIRLKRFQDAVAMFKSVSTNSFHSTTGLALATYRCGKSKDSFSLYNIALKTLSISDNEKSELLVAMAGMVYKFQGMIDAKTILFQSIQLKAAVPLSGLLAIYALGMLHDDPDLSKLAMSEILKMKLKNTESFSIAFLESYLMLKSNDPRGAITNLSRHAHIRPDDPALWRYMSQFCVLESCTNPRVASQSAQKVIILGQSKMDACKSLIIASLSELLLGNFKKGKRFAQKALHLYPDNPQNWAVLVSILLPDCDNLGVRKWALNMMAYVKDTLSVNEKFVPWVKSIEMSLN